MSSSERTRDEHTHPGAGAGAGAGVLAANRASSRLAVASSDPTRTQTLRDQYAAQLRKRYRAIKGGIRTVVVDQDYFGRADGTQSGSGTRGLGGNAGQHGVTPRPDPLPVPDVPLPAQPGYTFPSDAERIQAFRAWLQQAEDAVVLGGQSAANPANRWTSDYVRYAYGRGVSHANARLRGSGYSASDVDLGDAFSLPIHQDTLSVFYQRQFELLSGVNAAVGSDISRVLTEGMLAGQGPRSIASDLNQRVNAIGLRRANLIARTEVVHAYNEGALNRYERILGSQGDLQIVLEYTTAGDNQVCEECASLDGATYTVADARGLLPLHPACRCTWSPVSRASAGGS